TLAATLKFLDVSDCIMAEGSMRVDVNVNIKDEESGLKTEIAEIKNINSIRAIENALTYEVERQTEHLKNNETGTKETRRWDDIELKTIHMRNKEVGNDYRFSADGDIPDIYLSDEFIEEIKNNLPELPSKKQDRYMKDYKLSEYDANLLSHDRNLSRIFELTNKIVNDANTTANWILTELSRRLNEAEETANEMNLSVENFAKLINLAKENKVNNNVAKKLLREIYTSNEDPEKLAQERNLLQISDASFLEDVVNEVLEENPQSIEDIK